MLELEAYPGVDGVVWVLSNRSSKSSCSIPLEGRHICIRFFKKNGALCLAFPGRIGKACVFMCLMKAKPGWVRGTLAVRTRGNGGRSHPQKVLVDEVSKDVNANLMLGTLQRCAKQTRHTARLLKEMVG